MEKKETWIHKNPKLFTAIIIISIFIIGGIVLSFINKSSNSNTQLQTPPSQNSPTSTPSNIPTSSVTGSWHNVTTFTGTDDKTTDTFNIQGSKFRITYSVYPNSDYPQYASFNFFVYPEGETTEYTDTAGLSSGTDSTISYAGPGNYYIKVIAGNLYNWGIRVEDWY
jgi:hypothetical protein